MPPTNLFGLGYGVGPAGYGYPSVGRWSPLSLGTSLAAWYRADAGCYTDAACLFASASSQKLSRADEASLRTGDVDFTIAGWVNFATLGGLGRTIACKATGSTVEWALYSYSSDELIFAVGGFTQKVESSARTAATNYFVVASYDSAADTMSLYINDVLIGTRAATTAPTAGDSAFEIGNTLAGNPYMDGSCARFGFWKSAAGAGGVLSAGQRTSLYNAGAGKFYADLTTAEKVSLVEYWNLCESSSTRVGSHAGLNLTPTNGPTVAAGPGEGACVNNAPRKRIEDASGNARHRTQATIGKQPLYLDAIQNGRAAGRFDGTNDFDQVASNMGAQPVYVFSACKAADAATGMLWDGESNRIAASRGVYVGVGNQESYAGGGAGFGGAHTGGAFHVYEYRYDGASSEIVVDGVSLATGDGGSNGMTTGFTVGGDYTESFFCGLDEGETFIVVGAMTAGQKASARAYLRQRWNTP